MAENAFDALLGLDAAAREHAAAEAVITAATTRSDSRALTARVAGRVLRVSLAHVREVKRCPALAPMPGAQPWLVGATAWRGRAVAVVDLARFAFDAEAERGDTLLVCQHEDCVVGLRVDAVLDTTGAGHGARSATDGEPDETRDTDAQPLDLAVLLADPRLLHAGRWPRARRRAPAAASAEHTDER